MIAFVLVVPWSYIGSFDPSVLQPIQDDSERELREQNTSHVRGKHNNIYS